VLLIGNIRAKLTDFGMARLGDLNPQATRFTNTMCPGTDVYMPPEAVQDKPVYTEKIDCFSFGVIAIQTMTQEFPKPGDRQITINDPRYPRPIKMNIPEIERRQNHIHEVDPSHPLLPIALNCLKDDDDERPSAQQLCERIAALKKTDKYKNASEGVKNASGDCKEREHEQIQRLQQKLEANNHIIGQKDVVIAEKQQQLRQSRENIQQQSQQIQQLERDKLRLERESSQVIQDSEEKERQLGQLIRQLEEREQLIADIVQNNADLEEQVRVLRRQAQKQHGGTMAARPVPVDRANIRLTWREGEKCPYGLERYYDAAVYMTSDNSLAVYCVIDSDSHSEKENLYTYHARTSDWSLISDHPLWSGFAITVIDGQLTTVGGFVREGFPVESMNSDKLFSLSGEGSDKKWIEKFPPMPTKRYAVSTLYTGKALIVAGGRFVREVLTAVEVLNTETKQWHTASNLPQPLCQSSLILCDDLVYLLGGYNDELCSSVAAYSYSLNTLILPKSISERLISALYITRSPPWKRVAELPVKASTTVFLDDRLLAIGGLDAANKPITAVHTYQPTTNSWKIISHMTTPRSECLATVLPDNQLMVVGGRTTSNRLCNSVEFGIVV
jgi:hypothetical protein